MATQNKELLKIETRSYLLKSVAENDPTRFRDRTVPSKKGKGRKKRPRNSNRERRDYDE